MRRKELKTTKEQAMEILKACSYGTLSVVLPDGSPYGVPVNYCISEAENALFFHCAEAGEKIEAIRHCPKVSVSAVAEYTVVPENLTTLYRSAVVKGTAAVIEDTGERARRLQELCRAYSGSVLTESEIESEALKGAPHTAVVRIDIISVTGKCKPPRKD